MAGMLRWTDAQLAAHKARVIPIAPAAPELSGQERMRALGRLKTGEMNKTEAAYGLELERRKQAGEVLWYKFEGLKFRLADNTFYTPDYAVMLAGGELQAHEVKGARAIFEEDAKAKVKIAAAMYPLAFFVIFPKSKKAGGGWEVEEF